jgi:hypothetical protein
VFRGGTIAGDGTTSIQISGTRLLDEVHVDGAILYMGERAILNVVGPLHNDGRLMLADLTSDGGGGSFVSRLRVEGPVLIDGVGSIEPRTSFQNVIDGIGAGARLTAGPGQTLTAVAGTLGQISVPTTLQGVLGYDGGQWLLVNPDFVNDGLVRATNGSAAELLFFGIGGQGGWLADGGDLTFGAFAYPTQGAIAARNGGDVRLQGSTLSGSTLGLEPGASLNGWGRAQLGGAADVAGLVVADTTAPLTLAATGGTQVGATGTLRAAASGGLAIEGPSLTSAGQIEVQTGSRLGFAGDIQQLAGGQTRIDGVLDLDGGALLAAAGSSVSGRGRLEGSLALGGTLAPGASPGLLSIDGDLVLEPGAVLSIELGGTARGSGYDALDVGGTATLAGVLAVSVLPGFEGLITSGDVFEIAHAAGFLGAFANAPDGARVSSLDGLHSFAVHHGAASPYGADRLVLADYAPVPEPGTALLVLTGLAGLAARPLRRPAAGCARAGSSAGRIRA